MRGTTAWLSAIGLDVAGPQGRHHLHEADRLRVGGRVMSLRVVAGRVEGRVQGSHARPHLAELALPVWTDDQWRTVGDLLARQARHYAQLLAGQLPEQFDTVVSELDLTLLPEPDEWVLRCTCGGPVPCVHHVAVWMDVRERLDGDPYLITRLRGRSREQLLAEVRDRRVTRGRDSIPLASLSSDEWSRARIHPSEVPLPPVRRPATPAGPLRMLGEPAGWSGPTTAAAMFGPAVIAAARYATDLLAAGDDASGDVL